MNPNRTYPGPERAYESAPTLADENLWLNTASAPATPQQQREVLLRRAAYLDRVDLGAYRLATETLQTADGPARPSEAVTEAAKETEREAAAAAKELIRHDQEHGTNRGLPYDPDDAPERSYVRQEYAIWRAW